MLPALHDNQRRTLARISVMLMLGAAAVLPLTAQTSSVAAARETGIAAFSGVPAVPGPLTFPGFVLKRDPFRTQMLGAAAPGPVSSAMVTGQADAIGIVLPPNAGAGGDAAPPAVQIPSGGVAVRAVIVGERTRALVDFGGSVRVLAAGDAVGDRKVIAITAAGVRLSDGTTWPLLGEK
jgi:hypothetical protein